MTGFAEDPGPPFEAKFDKAAFLQWVQTQERRFELKDGRVIMQAGGTKRHVRLIGSITSALITRLDRALWAVAPCDQAVEIGEDIRYPDVVVERLLDDGRSQTTEVPVVLVEVLSPSSVGTDMTVKLAEYTSLASLEAYIVFSQDAPLCWVWQRAGEARDFPLKPFEVRGSDSVIEILGLGVALPSAEIYRGIAVG